MDASQTTCPACSGRGYTETSSRLTFGCDTAVRNTACSACSGTGHTTCGDASASPASPPSDSTPSPTVSAVAGAGTSPQVPPDTVTCDSCTDRAPDAPPCSICGGRGWLHDQDTWPGLARASAEQAERFRVELSEARSQLASVRTERDLLRRQVETAQHEVRLACEKAQRKIDEMHREHRAEIEDLKRQLRLASQRIVDLKIERAA